MSPRTPVAMVLGTLVTVSLFGLMQSMVRQPETYSGPPGRDWDPWVAPNVVEPAPPPTPRKLEPRPTARDKPKDTGMTALVTENNLVDEPSTIEIPRAVGKPTFNTQGTLNGKPGLAPEDWGGSSCGGAPRIKFMVAPDYPRAQRAAGVEGEVVVEFLVGVDGRVTEAVVVSAKPRGAFEATTLRSVKRWTYQAQAADCGGAPTRMRETVSYRLEGVED
jgi:TonB family protein